MTSPRNFEPNWVSPPGETILELMTLRNLTNRKLAEELGEPVERLAGLLVGEEEITDSIAMRLAAVFNVSASFWLQRERQYREDLCRLNPVDWLKELPIADMKRFGWIKEGTISECLRFFGVNTVVKWKRVYGDLLGAVAFRTSECFEAEEGATAAWLRRGEIDAASQSQGKWNRNDFMQALTEMRKLTRESDPSIFVPRLKDACAKCGVAVSIVRPPRGCRASGAARRTDEGGALLLLSFRYLTDDHFWFTFFHEAGHLILHEGTFLEGVSSKRETEEREANEFAGRILIPDEYREELASLPIQLRPIFRFARKAGVSPGIVVGQLQHIGRIKPSHFNKVKSRYKWE